MKNLLVSVFLLTTVHTVHQEKALTSPEDSSIPSTGNLFIITTDGFRWQEVFTGADSSLLHNAAYTPDTETIKMLYWDNDPEQRRKKLMPFFWNVLAKRGQLYGNRYYDNKVNISNTWAISYPGYHEIFTGNDDITVSTNKKISNNKVNVLEYLNSREAYMGRVAVFTSWDVFPYILNEKRNNLPVNAGYENIKDDFLSETELLINKVQEEGVNEKAATRHDALTFETAKEYLKKHQPKVLYIGLGETDEFAHIGRYDLYLQQAAQFDKMLAELWHWVQTTPDYKDNTTFIITTDHGRGSKPGKWSTHGYFTKGSSQTWLAVMGPGIQPAGEIKDKQQIFQKQLAQTIAAFMGERFQAEHDIAEPITLGTNSIYYDNGKSNSSNQ
jgi:hypothetical protein